jgi:hypothetical protein
MKKLCPMPWAIDGEALISAAPISRDAKIFFISRCSFKKAATTVAASDQTVHFAHKISNLAKSVSRREGACSKCIRSTERAYAPSTMVIGQGKSGSLIFVKMRSEKIPKNRTLTRDRSPERRTPNDLTKVSTHLEKDDVEQPSRLPCRMQRLRRCLRYLHRLMS